MNSRMNTAEDSVDYTDDVSGQFILNDSSTATAVLILG